jgi:parallel beta-helix repeat protein
MKTQIITEWAKYFAVGLLLLLISAGCGPSQEELDATATSEAAAAFATQTAEAPTSTPIPTDTPSPTNTPTATPLPTATPSPTPLPLESILENAYAALDEASSFHMAMDMGMEVGITGLTMEIGIDFEGDYQAPDRIAGTYDMTMLGESTVFEAIIVGDTMYIKEPGTDEWVESTDQSATSLVSPVGEFRPSDFEELTFISEETINDQAIYHFSGLASNLNEQLAQNLDLAELGELFNSIEFVGDLVVEFWVGVEDGLLYQTSTSGDLSFEADTVEAGFDEMTMLMDVLVQYSDYDKPVSIEVPEVSASTPEFETSSDDILSAFPPDGPIVQLSPDGTGDYPDIVTAIVDVEPGTTIELSPGTYNLNESIIVEQSVRLVGAGKDETILISDAPDWAIVFVGDGPFILQEMAVIHEGSQSADAVVVIDGSYLLSDCHLSGAKYYTDDDIGAGAKMLGTATGEVNGCITDNNEAGIMVADQSRSNLTGNICSDNEFVGIVYFGESSGVAMANECQNNGADGVQVWDTAAPILEDNIFSFNGEAGIGYFNDAAGEALRNDCSANGLYGIYIDEFAGPYLEQNRCNGNADSGFVFFGDTFAIAIDNECSDNDFYGMVIAEQAAPILMDNTCNGNGDSGIASYDESSSVITANECAENLIGIYVQDTSNPDLNDNNCHDNFEADIQDERNPADEARFIPDFWPS